MKQEKVHQVGTHKLAANRFGPSVNPPISPEDMASLAESIHQEGVRIPLVVWRNGKGNVVVSGNTRLRIAKRLKLQKVPVIFRKFADNREAKLFAITDNVARRQLHLAQKAELALKIQGLLKVGQGFRSDRQEPPSEMTEVDSRAMAAKMAGISTGTMSQMRIVLEHGETELVGKVRSGRVKVSAAYEIVRNALALERPRRGGRTPRRGPILADEPVMTCMEGHNGDLIAHAARLYLRKGDRVADVTYGRGQFWRKVDTSEYDFRATDLQTTEVKMDFRRLDYADSSFDAVVFDPPYLVRGGPKYWHYGKYQRINKRITLGEVLGLFRDGMKEAHRVLRPGGYLWVKCKDQHDCPKIFLHVDVHAIAVQELAMSPEELFVLKQSSPAISHGDTQTCARINHSFLWIFRRQ